MREGLEQSYRLDTLAALNRSGVALAAVDGRGGARSGDRDGFGLGDGGRGWVVTTLLSGSGDRKNGEGQEGDG